jgi:OmpA-OmpF porin, OOP family
MKLTKYVALIASIILTIMLGGCFQATSAISGKFNKPGLSDKQSMVVFYREAGEKDFIPTVWVEDHIVGALTPNSYAQTLACPGKTKIKVYDCFGCTGSSEDIYIQTQRGKVTYLLVSKDKTAEHFTVYESDEKIAEKVLASAHRSSIVNRHTSLCSLDYVELDTDALFVFGKSILTPKGHEAIAKIAQDIKSLGVNVKKLRIEGHTDRIGSSESNDKLSSARADAVKNELKTSGISIPIDSLGLGERYPKVTNCSGEKATPKLIECLAPNRRVKIEIIGLTSSNASL